jgi:hemoglobin-like flavoprotein
MTPQEIALVQQSFKKVLPIKEAAAEMFYNRLFVLDPSLRELFPTDLAEQGRKLMAMLATAVGGLHRLDEIVPAVQALGVRHRDYSVRPEHYRTVGEALVWTLAQGLGKDFTDPVKDAWIAAYTLLSSTMIQAATDKAA